MQTNVKENTMQIIILNNNDKEKKKRNRGTRPASPTVSTDITDDKLNQSRER